jgi:hypothetical protein
MALLSSLTIQLKKWKLNGTLDAFPLVDLANHIKNKHGIIVSKKLILF